MICSAARSTLCALALLSIAAVAPAAAQPDKPPPPPPANPLGPPTTPVVIDTDVGPLTSDDSPGGLSTAEPDTVSPKKKKPAGIRRPKRE